MEPLKLLALQLWRPSGPSKSTAPGSERRGSDYANINSQSQTNSPKIPYSTPTNLNYWTYTPPILSEDTPQHEDSTSYSPDQLSSADQISIHPADGVKSALEEKRQRNNRASARFRKRRKDKEKESARNISDLTSKLREVTKERDRLYKEIAYLKALAYKYDASTPEREWQHNAVCGHDDNISGRDEAASRTGTFPPPVPPLPIPHVTPIPQTAGPLPPLTSLRRQPYR